MYDSDEECKKMVKRIDALCREKGITHNALAKKAKISNSALSYIFSGKSKPYVFTLLQICNALEVSVHEILGEELTADQTEEIAVAVECQRKSSVEPELDLDEQKLVQAYRGMTKKKKAMMRTFTEMLEQYQP